MHTSKVFDGLGLDFRSQNDSKTLDGNLSSKVLMVWGPISVVKTSPWLQLELPDSTWLAQPSYIRRLLLWRSAPYLEFQLHGSNPSSTQPTTARLLIRV